MVRIHLAQFYGFVPKLKFLEAFERFRYGGLAQLVEHLTFNQVVRGSTPRCFRSGEQWKVQQWHELEAVFSFGKHIYLTYTVSLYILLLYSMTV